MTDAFKSRVWRWSLAVALVGPSSVAHGGVVFGLGPGLTGGYRWDAAPRMIAGNERSLSGSLRFSVQGGSYTAYRDLFAWSALPTAVAFQTAVEQAFAAWTGVDPASGLGSTLSFTPDFGTAVVGAGGFGGINTSGAEIDLFGTNAGDAGTRGTTSFSAIGALITLTSGTPAYPGGGAISGADLHINSNPGAIYTLDGFRRLLTHEIGHSLGLGDVEDFGGNGFIDDNYDGTSNATALATLTNSWALSVNSLNPGVSLLTRFPAGTVANAAPGIDTVGVNILMESDGLGIAAGNPVTNLVPLTNDDYGTRQFLYPALVPEAGAWLLVGAVFSGTTVVRAMRRRRAR